MFAQKQEKFFTTVLLHRVNAESAITLVFLFSSRILLNISQFSAFLTVYISNCSVRLAHFLELPFFAVWLSSSYFIFVFKKLDRFLDVQV